MYLYTPYPSTLMMLISPCCSMTRGSSRPCAPATAGGRQPARRGPPAPRPAGRASPAPPAPPQVSQWVEMKEEDEPALLTVTAPVNRGTVKLTPVNDKMGRGLNPESAAPPASSRLRFNVHDLKDNQQVLLFCFTHAWRTQWRAKKYFFFYNGSWHVIFYL